MFASRKLTSPVFACPSCGDVQRPRGAPTVCRCGHPLEVRFAWKGNPPARESVDTRARSLWRYRSVLPPITGQKIVSLGEGWTPLTAGGEYDGARLWFKDETVNPTGSFKDRGMAMAISHLRAYGIGSVSLPSAGNAGVSAAAYCQRAGMRCHVYFPGSVPAAFVSEVRGYGARVTLAGESLAEAARTMEKEKNVHRFDLSTLKEPFRVEGKKTLGYEIAEQMNWEFPDVVVYPTGGGTGLIGMWKAFREMSQMGWVEGNRPRMVAVQSDRCAPVVEAFIKGRETVVPFRGGETAALGLDAPAPIGGPWMLRVLRESGGTAVTAEEAEIEPARKRLGLLSGTDPSPEGGVAWLGFEKLAESGWIGPGEQAVVVITGSQIRYRS
ncbi:MAG: threonine synthase [Fidelibacterota bacterium]